MRGAGGGPYLDGWPMVGLVFFFFQAEDGIRDRNVTGVQTCALPISLGASGNIEDGRIMAVGMGRPLLPGRYYIGVLGAAAGSMSFTLVSRGIGDGMTIPVTPLDFNGGTNRVQALPPREAAYYSVDIPQGATSWKAHLSAEAGESLLIASMGTLPNLTALQSFNINQYCGHKMQKVGDEFYLLLPPAATNVLTPGRY